MMILSGDPPRSRVLSILLVVIIAALAMTPFVFPGAKAMNVATKICIFAALVASYDLLLGYTGSVSFAHTMFYGIGSYSIAIALYSMGPSWAAVATGVVTGLPLARSLAGAPLRCPDGVRQSRMQGNLMSWRKRSSRSSVPRRSSGCWPPAGGR